MEVIVKPKIVNFRCLVYKLGIKSFGKVVDNVPGDVLSILNGDRLVEEIEWLE